MGRDRYRKSSLKDKSKILNQFIAVTGHHGKHGITLLVHCEGGAVKDGALKGRRIYGNAVRDVVTPIWEASDRICGKRLKAAMTHLVESMERHGRLDVDPDVKGRALSVSAAALDRLLKPAATELCTGWTEAVPLLAREQSPVAGLEAIGRQLPFPVLGIDSDNDSALINDTFTQYCADRGIEFTRS